MTINCETYLSICVVTAASDKGEAKPEAEGEEKEEGMSIQLIYSNICATFIYVRNFYLFIVQHKYLILDISYKKQQETYLPTKQINEIC